MNRKRIKFQPWRPQTWQDALEVVPPILLTCTPLAIGTYHALIPLRKPGISNSSIHCLIQRHTSQPEYIRALAAGGKRFSLAGVPVEDISDEHRSIAAEQIKELCAA